MALALRYTTKIQQTNNRRFTHCSWAININNYKKKKKNTPAKIESCDLDFLFDMWQDWALSMLSILW